METFEKENLCYCEECNQYVKETTTIDTLQGTVDVCDECLDKYEWLDSYGKHHHIDNVRYCDCCEKPFDEDDLYDVESRHRYLQYCDDCCAEYTFSNKNGYFLHSDYYQCDNCGDEIPLGDEYQVEWEVYCEDCYRESIKLKPYHNSKEYRDLEFYGDNYKNRYIGIEWELDGGGANRENAVEIFEDEEELLWSFEEDGSLDDGFEAVSQPMSIKYALDLPWDDMAKRAIKLGYTIKNGVGNHIHVSRNAFRGKKEIVRLIRFFSKNYDDLAKFSGRDYYNANKWASRYVVYKNKSIDDLYYEASCDRYYAINLDNDETIEFRLFGSASTGEQMRAYIQLVDVLIDIVHFRKYSNKWSTVVRVAKLKGYQDLIDRLVNLGIVKTA